MGHFRRAQRSFFVRGRYPGGPWRYEVSVKQEALPSQRQMVGLCYR